jgi:serine/threonine protein kinase
LELFTRQAVFLGGDELSQMAAIIRILGYPIIEGELARVAKGWRWLSSGPRLDLQRLVPEEQAGTERGGLLGIAREKNIPPLALDLIQSLLDYNPLQRPTAGQALQHAWFKETHPTSIPCPDGQHEPILVAGGEWHEWEMKWRKRGGVPPDSQQPQRKTGNSMDAPFPEAYEAFKPDSQDRLSQVSGDAREVREDRRRMEGDVSRKRRPSTPERSSKKPRWSTDLIKHWPGRHDGYSKRSTTGDR